jgi:hypothetical protein
MGPRRTSKACGFQQLATLTASIGLTVPTTPDGTKANACIIVATGQNVRWRDDGTAPTATVGMLLKTTDAPFYYDGDLLAIRFIESAASGVLNVCYYYDGAL